VCSSDLLDVARDLAVAAAQQPAVDLTVLHRRFWGTWETNIPSASAAASATE
jgi:hypothetical protein